MTTKEANTLLARDNPLGRYTFPFSGTGGEGIFVLRPIVQCRRIKVSTVRSYQRFHFWIHDHLVEQPEVEQRTIELTGEHWFQVDGLLCIVGKSHSQCIQFDNFDGLHFKVKWFMSALRHRCNGQWFSANLQSAPVSHLFRLISFHNEIT